jgi:hypothetical protein
MMLSIPAEEVDIMSETVNRVIFVGDIHGSFDPLQCVPVVRGYRDRD